MFRSSKLRSSRFRKIQISEFQVSEFLSSEFLVSEFFRSGAPTSQPTSFIVQEAVELADTTKTMGSEFLSFGVLASCFWSSWPRIFGVPDLEFSEFQVRSFGMSQVRSLLGFGVVRP